MEDSSPSLGLCCRTIGLVGTSSGRSPNEWGTWELEREDYRDRERVGETGECVCYNVL